MLDQKNKRPRIYFSEMQRRWSELQADSAYEMIDGMSRHNADGEIPGTASVPHLRLV